jgi:hypothetical protein
MAPLLPRPAAVLDLTMSLAGRAMEAMASVLALPARTLALLDGLELMVARLIVVLDRAEELVERVDGVTGSAEDAVREVRALTAATAAVVTESELVAGRAAAVVGRAEETTGATDELMAAYVPALRHAAPLADQFLRQLSAEEIAAAVRLVDELPKLTHHLITNVLPILRTLDRVGPDIHDLLEVTRDLKLAIAGIPGLGMLRRRGEERLTGEG